MGGIGMCGIFVSTAWTIADKRMRLHIPAGPMIQSANIIAFVAKLTFTLAATFTRLSLICFYYRLIKDSGIQWFTWVLHASVVWTLSVCIVFICLTIWLCNPVDSYWIYPPENLHTCLNEGKVMLGGGVINSASDLLTVVLPIPIVMRLQMPLKQRIGVCILLCLGFVVTIAGAIRTYFTWKSLLESWDETLFAYPVWIAAAVEIDLGMVSFTNLCSEIAVNIVIATATTQRIVFEDIFNALLLKITQPFTRLLGGGTRRNVQPPSKLAMVPTYKIRIRAEGTGTR